MSDVEPDPMTSLGADIGRALSQLEAIDVDALTEKQRDSLEAAKAELSQALELYRWLMRSTSPT